MRNWLKRLMDVSGAVIGLLVMGPLNIPGFDPHLLHGKLSRYAIKVSGPWRITFEWSDGDAWRVDLEQYH